MPEIKSSFTTHAFTAVSLAEKKLNFLSVSKERIAKRYLPIKSSDFIFSVLSEEMGFVMSVAIVLLYVLLIIRLIKISRKAKDEFASLMVIGVAGMTFFHFVQNIGMTIGLLPITGVPLPFLSYGGSNILTNGIAIAIALNVSARSSNNNLFID